MSFIEADAQVIGGIVPSVTTVGECAVVRDGVMDEEFTGLLLGGWRGRVTSIDAENGTAVITWDGPTALAIPDGYIRRCIEQGVDWKSMVLEAREIEPCAATDTLDETYEAVQRRNASAARGTADEAQMHIRTALLGLDRADLADCFRAWTVYIDKRVTFPFEGEILENPLAASAVPPGTFVTVTRVSGVDGATGVLAEVQCAHRKFTVPIASVRPTPWPPDLLPLQAYSAWLAERS